MSCGVNYRCGSDLALLWLWHRPTAAAPIQPLAWELPYAAGVAPQKKKFKNERDSPKGGQILESGVLACRGQSQAGEGG